MGLFSYGSNFVGYKYIGEEAHLIIVYKYFNIKILHITTVIYIF